MTVLVRHDVSSASLVSSVSFSTTPQQWKGWTWYMPPPTMGGGVAIHKVVSCFMLFSLFRTCIQQCFFWEIILSICFCCFGSFYIRDEWERSCGKFFLPPCLFLQSLDYCTTNFLTWKNTI
jgi:hypothetical protein